MNADQMAERAVGLMKQQGGWPEAAAMLEQASRTYFDEGRYDAAEAMYRRALSIGRTPEVLLGLGSILTLKRGKLANLEALDHINEALVMMMKEREDNPSFRARAFFDMSDCYKNLQKVDERRKYLEIARQESERAGPDCQLRMHILNALHEIGAIDRSVLSGHGG